MNNKEVKSNIVSKLVNNNVGVNSKISYAQSKFSLLHPQKNNDKKIILSGIILITLIIIISIVLFFLSNNDKLEKDKKKDKSLYEETYDNLKFKEDNSLNKLYCTKNVVSEKNNMSTKKIEIYYFKNDQLVTSIFHTYIVLEDKYMDYYNSIIDSYSKSLEDDYNYSNVKTDLLSKDNTLLVTILVDNVLNNENIYKISNFDGYNEAKKALIDSGFACK